MAIEENIRLFYEADISDAQDKIKELRDLTNELKNISKEFNVAPDSTDGLDQLIGKVLEVERKHNDLKNELGKKQKSYAFQGMMEEADALAKRIDMIDKRMAQTRGSVNNAYRQRERATGHSAKIPPSSRMYSHGQREEERIHQTVLNENRDFQRRMRSTRNLVNTAMNTRMLNSNQANTLREEIRKFTDEQKVTEARSRAEDDIETTRVQLLEAGDKLESLYRKMESLSEDPEGNRMQMIETERLIKEQKDTMETLTDTIRLLSERIHDIDYSQNLFTQRADELRSANIKEVGDRTSVRGAMFERASATALATMGAVAYQLKSVFDSGTTVYDNVAPTSRQLGNSMGDYDFRSIRRGILDAGIEGGYTSSQQAMDMAKAITENAGAMDNGTLESIVTRMGIGSRALPVDQDMMNDFMGSLMRVGAIDGDANAVENIQKGFLGAIKMSGMEGREEEQIRVLNEMSKGLFEGRIGNEQELRNRMAITTLLGRTGNESVRGEQGAQMLQSMDSAIKGASPYSTLGIMMGVGSDPQFQGYQGMWNWYQLQEEGLTPETLNQTIQGARVIGGGTEEGTKVALKQLWQSEGVNLTTDQIDGLLAAVGPDGQITQEEIDRITTQGEAEGETEYEKRVTGFLESSDATLEAIKANTEKRDLLLQDNGLIDALNALRKEVAEWGGGSTMGAFGSIATGALATGIGSMLANVGSFGLSALIRKLTGTKFNLGDTGGAMTALAGWFKGKGGGGGLLSKLFGMEAVSKGTGPIVAGSKTLADDAVEGAAKAGTFTKATSWMKGKGGSALSWLKGKGGQYADDFMKPVVDAAKGGTTGSGSWLSKLPKPKLSNATKGMGKLGSKIKGLPLLTIALAGYDIMTSEDKSLAIAENVGGILGGAGAGAAMGSLFGPVGTILGGIVGGIGGTKLGASIHDWFGKTFGAKEVSAAELTPEEKAQLTQSSETISQNEEVSTTQAEEQSLASQKQQTTLLRQELVTREEENLSFFERLLKEVDRLLAVAKAQNGFMGMQDTVTGGGGSSMGVGGNLDYTGSGDFWTSTNIKNHDLAKTVNTLTAEQLDEWINSKAPKNSIMRGMGETFMKAGQESGLDPRYLVAHAAHETAWGTSRIARDKGNMYGIGAFDASPYASAYGYNGTEAGIIEGAKWIAKNYYGRGQTTLETMRHNGGTHEYATDPLWDEKIAAIMKGSENYTQPSVNITTNVTVTSTGDADADGRKIANAVNRGISPRFTQETRLRT